MANTADKKGVVVSFRVTEEIATLLEKESKKPAMGVHSLRTLCRRVATDYVRGRLEYKDESDREIDREVVKAD